MPTPNLNLTQYTANDVTSYLTKYNEDMAKIDSGVKAADDKGATAITEAQTATGKAQDSYQLAETANNNAESALVGLSTLLPVFNTGVIQIYTHVKQGTIHNLIPTLSEEYPVTGNIRFKATAPFNEGDTFKVDNQNVVASLINGEILPDAFFISGATVTCELEDSRLNFKGGTGSGAKPVITLTNSATRPTSPLNNTVWIKDNLIPISIYNVIPVNTEILEGLNIVTGESTATVNFLEEPFTNISIIDIIYNNGGVSQSIDFEVYVNGVWVSPFINIYPGALVGNNGSNSGTFGSFFTDLTGVTGNNINSTIPYIEIDLTNLKKLAVNFQGSTVYSGLWLGVPGENSGDERYPSFYITNLFDARTPPFRFSTIADVITGEPQEIEIDVSSFTGVYRLLIGAYSTSTSRATKFEIFSVKGI